MYLPSVTFTTETNLTLKYVKLFRLSGVPKKYKYIHSKNLPSFFRNEWKEKSNPKKIKSSKTTYVWVHLFSRSVERIWDLPRGHDGQVDGQQDAHYHK